jgi:hypothetical protein
VYPPSKTPFLAVLVIFHNVQFTGGAPARGEVFVVPDPSAIGVRMSTSLFYLK